MINGHPILQTKSAALAYLIIWISAIGIHFGVLYMLSYTPNVFSAMVDAMVFNVLFALIGLSIWFIVKFNKVDQSNRFNLLFTHLSVLALIIVIWLGIGNAISSRIILEEEYHEFLRNSAPWRIATAAFLYMIISLIYYLFEFYQDLQIKYKNEIRLEDMVKESELNLLKSQINPHFLFNSLNSISSLTITNGEKAQDMIIKLSDFLRYTVSKDENRFSTLSSELENVKRYLEIEKIRFGDKLQYEFLFNDSCEDFQIPIMILQPLYENAVKHGVYESAEPIVIKTSCSMYEDHMQICIVNNFEKGVSVKKGAGIGLKNISERLKLIYLHEQLIETQKTETHFTVNLFIPKQSKVNE